MSFFPSGGMQSLSIVYHTSSKGKWVRLVVETICIPRNSSFSGDS